MMVLNSDDQKHIYYMFTSLYGLELTNINDLCTAMDDLDLPHGGYALDTKPSR